MGASRADVARAAEAGEAIAVGTARALIADAEEEVQRAERAVSLRRGKR